MKYLLLVTVLFYKTETKYLNGDGFGFGKTQVQCDTGRVRIQGRYFKTDSTYVIRKYGVIKTFYWYKTE